MKIGRMAMAWAVAGLLYGGTATAQQPVGRATQMNAPGLQYPASSTGRLVAYEYDKYYAPEAAEPASPSDAAATPAPAAAASSAPVYYAAPAGGGGGGGVLGGPLMQRFLGVDREIGDIKHPVSNIGFFERNNIKFDGYIASGYVWNPNQPIDKFNGPVNWMDRANEYDVQGVWTNFRKEAQTGDGFDWGWNFTSVYGTNARFFTAAGLEDRINKSQSFYNLALPNMYLEFAYNDLKVKVGRFYSPIGFYGVSTAENFFPLIPYTYQYGEVFTNTGALAQYQMTDDLNIGLGFSKGWDNFDRSWNKSSGPIALIVRNNLLKDGDSLAWYGQYSREPNLDPALPQFRHGVPAPDFTPRYVQSMVYSRPITDKLTWIAQSDYGHQTNPFGPTSVRNHAQWYGLNQYWYYKVNNVWSWGLGAEWFRDDGGFRVGGFLPNQPNNTNGGPTLTRGLSLARGGYDGSFYRVTAGPRWTPRSNLIIRPTLAWDWYSGPDSTIAQPAGQPPNNLPFLHGNRAASNQIIVATDAVIWY